MEVKGKLTTRKNDDMKLAEAYRKIYEKDVIIGQMDQEIIEVKAMAASVEMELKVEGSEKESWKENCRLILEMQDKGEDNGVQAEKVKAMEKKIMQSKHPCRKFLRGHCKQGKDCKFSHGDVNTMIRARLRNTMNSEEMSGLPRAESGKEHC